MPRHSEILRAADRTGARLARSGQVAEQLLIRGVFVAECFGADGQLKWRDEFRNTVVTVGKNLILDQALAGSAYTAAEFLGLISSASYSSISAADTMASHSGWLEAGSANACEVIRVPPEPGFADRGRSRAHRSGC